MSQMCSPRNLYQGFVKLAQAHCDKQSSRLSRWTADRPRREIPEHILPNRFHCAGIKQRMQPSNRSRNHNIPQIRIVTTQMGPNHGYDTIVIGCFPHNPRFTTAVLHQHLVGRSDKLPSSSYRQWAIYAACSHVSDGNRSRYMHCCASCEAKGIETT
jgi:hypothetical protein